jgi:hypothetical protein
MTSAMWLNPKWCNQQLCRNSDHDRSRGECDSSSASSRTPMNSRGVLFFCATGEGRWLMSDAEVRLAENEPRLGSDQLADWRQ